MRRSFEAGELEAHATTPTLCETLRRINWVVYAKPPFAEPESVLAYLGRYTHRIAISNHRLMSLEHGRLAFRCRDYAGGSKEKVMRLDVLEFIRRFLLHVLPKGFVRIRHYGLLANRHRKEKIARCRALLAAPAPAAPEQESVCEKFYRLSGVDVTACPACGEGRMMTIAEIPRSPWRSSHPIRGSTLEAA